jgi:hypothetical protein
MVTFRILALALAGALWLAPKPSLATSVPFGDSVRYWAGFANGSSDDGKDTIGYPNLTGGEAFFENGRLTAVRIDYTGPFSLAATGRGSVIPGDLFVDADGDGDWDYVMKAVTGPQTAGVYTALPILDVSGEAPAYLLSGADNSGHWQGYNIRGDHPYAWNGGGTAIGTGTLTVPDLLAGGGHSLLFELGEGVAVGSQLVIAFGPSCANDVLFERLGAPVPEPSAALLFAAGLGLALRAPRRRA